MFKNTKATLFTLAAAAAILIIAAGSPATAGDEIMSYDPPAETKLKAYDPQIGVYNPGIRAYDPKVSAHTTDLSFDTSPVLKRKAVKPGQDTGPILDVSPVLRSDDGKHTFPLWRLMFRIINLRWDSGS